MSRYKTVTISTDGQRDYVALPDGVKLILGTISMAKLVDECALSPRSARRALDEFLRFKEAVLPLDMDLMEPLFVPKRSRMSFAFPLVPPLDRTSSTEGTLMADPTETPVSIGNQIGLIEQQVTQIEKLATAGLPTTGAVTGLRTLVASLHFKDYGDQSKNDMALGLGAPKVDTVDGTQPPVPKELTAPKVASSASVQVLADNASLAETVLSQVAETDKTIDMLVTAGRKFNASKAKGDLFVVANGVAEVLQQADLAMPYVKDDLVKLAHESARIHALFASAKV